MSAAYDRRARQRKAENERRLCGETLAAFHERENPTRTAPGAGLSRVRCSRTDDLFNPTRQLFDRNWNEEE